MDDTSNNLLNGLSPEARRCAIDTASLTPRDKENAGANSTRNSQAAALDQPKVTSTISASAAAAPPSKTPVRARTGTQPAMQRSNPSFFSSATTPSPVSTTVKAGPAAKEISSCTTSKQHSNRATTPAPPAVLSLQKSPPGTSQVLRKHFQSLGFASPQTLNQQRLLTSGAVRLTPNSRKKVHKGNQTLSSRRVGFDGTKYTPSKELLKSTISSRNQRVDGLQDMSMLDEPPSPETNVDDGQNQLSPTHPFADTTDDETSTVASAATMDDSSFDISLPSTSHQSLTTNNLSVMPAPLSPLTPRMGCLNPVALTLLNDGKEDYNYLLTQDALYPIPKVEDTADMAVQPGTASAAASPCCLSPTQSFVHSPAEVRATLSHAVRSSLARPIVRRQYPSSYNSS